MMSSLSVGDVIRVKRSCVEFTKRLAASEFPEMDIETLQRVVNSDLVVQCASACRYVYASDDSGTCIRVANVHAEIVSRLPVYMPEGFLEGATPNQIKLSKQDLLALIDIAIDAGDKEWFNELHSKLSALA